MPPRNGCWDRSAPEGTDSTLSSLQPARHPVAPQFPNFGGLITTFQDFGDLIYNFQKLVKNIDFTIFWKSVFYRRKSVFSRRKSVFFWGGAFFQFFGTRGALLSCHWWSWKFMKLFPESIDWRWNAKMFEPRGKEKWPTIFWCFSNVDGRRSLIHMMMHQQQYLEILVGIWTMLQPASVDTVTQTLNNYH